MTLFKFKVINRMVLDISTCMLLALSFKLSINSDNTSNLEIKNKSEISLAYFICYGQIENLYTDTDECNVNIINNHNFNELLIFFNYN